jgi:hypothetical protein
VAFNALYGDIGEAFDAHQVKPQGIFERGRHVAAGAPIDITYDSTHYTGSGSLVWTVKPGEITTQAYDLAGMRMTLALWLVGTTVSGTGTSLRFLIPGGFVSARSVAIGAGFLSDNGANVAGGVAADLDSNMIRIFKLDGTNWAASTANTSILVTIPLWVKSQAI